ncbi:MAG TPA: preprotein translocase subunit SecE [Fibrobacteria bacterium]|nr:preprotein translocase subunit SecE [Fibrobacteria bacterium]
MRKLYQYFLEVIAEGKKVTWPQRSELIESTWIVMLFSLLCGLFITGVDMAVGVIIEQILGKGV